MSEDPTTTDGGLEEFANLVRDALAGLDPVPDDVVQRGKDIFQFRNVDAELAVLTFDSSAEPAGVGLRAEVTVVTMLGFEAGSRRIDLEIERETGSVTTISGQILPAGNGQVAVEGPTQSVEESIDELGRFVIAVRPGPIRLRVTPAEGSELLTDTFIV